MMRPKKEREGSYITRKDYVLIADTLSVLKEKAFKSKPDITREEIADRTAWVCGINAAADAISLVMQADNPRFDRALFLKAAGVAK